MSNEHVCDKECQHSDGAYEAAARNPYLTDEYRAKLERIIAAQPKPLLPSPLLIVTYPELWAEDKVAKIKAATADKWANFILLPGQVDTIETKVYGVDPTTVTLDVSESTQRSHAAVAISFIGVIVSLIALGFALWVKFS